MLNDLLAIEKGLAAHGVDLVDRHPDIKDMAKGWAFRTRLDFAGRIVSLDIVSEAGRGALWTLRDGQHNGFPGLKTAAGLISVDAEARNTHNRIWEADKTPTGRRNELLRLLGNHVIGTDQAASWPNFGHRKRIKERLEVLRPLGHDSLTSAIPAAFERFLVALDATPSFLEDLLAVLSVRICERGDEWLDLVRAALLGPVALAIDIKDNDFERDAGDPRQIRPVSAALSGLAGAETDQGDSEVFCALSGRSLKLHAGNFPQPNLPGLGQTYIFSRNRDIPSLTRYGRTADASTRNLSVVCLAQLPR